jgi:phage tail sheath gpL-like
MAVAFNEIPSNLRVPLFYAEVNSGGSVFNSNSRLLLIGQKVAAGKAKLDEPVLVANGNEDELFGTHGMIASMVRIARENAPFQEIWALPVTNSGTVYATGTVTLTAISIPASLSTTYVIYIGGRRYRTTVTSSDTAASVATAVAALVNADLAAQVSAVAAAGVITLTALHPGTLGNSIDIRTGYYGDEPSIANASLIVPMTGGSGDPDISAGLAALGSEEFDWIVMPYSDSVNLNEMADFLSNSSGRWSPMEQLYGHCISIKAGTVGTLSASGLVRNDPHTTLIGVNKFPTPIWDIAAAWGAKAAKHLSAAPELSRPLQFLTLSGVMAPKISDRFSRVDRNTLLYDGIATYGVQTDGSVVIERSITTYQRNAVGFADMTFLDIQTVAQSMYAIRYLRTKVTNAHGRQALGRDDNPPMQGVSRPRDVKATIVAGYTELNQLAVVENVDAFEQALIVERSATDPNRIDTYLPIDHMNQLRVIAINATSFLEYPSNL